MGTHNNATTSNVTNTNADVNAHELSSPRCKPFGGTACRIGAAWPRKRLPAVVAIQPRKPSEACVSEQQYACFVESVRVACSLVNAVVSPASIVGEKETNEKENIGKDSVSTTSSSTTISSPTAPSSTDSKRFRPSSGSSEPGAELQLFRFVEDSADVFSQKGKKALGMLCNFCVVCFVLLFLCNIVFVSFLFVSFLSSFVSYV
jgi:hypothetical protein